jgi:hypothetical protein
MINLINRILKKFNLQLTSKKEEEPQEEYSLVEETVKFLDTFPKDNIRNWDECNSLYAGDINYIKDKTGKTYYQDKEGKYYCDYDMKNPSPEVLGHMIAETTFTKEQLEEKLKND